MTRLIDADHLRKVMERAIDGNLDHTNPLFEGMVVGAEICFDILATEPTVEMTVNNAKPVETVKAAVDLIIHECNKHEFCQECPFLHSTSQSQCLLKQFYPYEWKRKMKGEMI